MFNHFFKKLGPKATLLIFMLSLLGLIISGCSDNETSVNNNDTLPSVEERVPSDEELLSDEDNNPTDDNLELSDEIEPAKDEEETGSGNGNKAEPAPSGTLTVHYIDVGQGDATLLKASDGTTILIDAGRHNRNDVVPYLKSIGINSIDLVIGTHPHADHIGQVDKVLNYFDVSEVWMPGTVHTTQTFERVIDAIAESNVNYHEPRAGETFQVGPIKLELFNPTRITGQFHEDSISMRATFGNVAFMFTGDAEAKTEREIIRRHNDVTAQILKLGHHGSITSSIPEFLKAVNPEITIYSAGRGNSYGHPHNPIIDRIRQLNIDIYGTDVHGTIKVKTDGSTYEISTSKTGRVEVREETDEQPKPEPAPEPKPAPTPDPEPAPSPEPDVGTVNINTASKEELKEIIHISDVRAEELITLRPFSSVDDLTRIRGIGPARVADIKEQGIATAN